MRDGDDNFVRVRDPRSMRTRIPPPLTSRIDLWRTEDVQQRRQPKFLGKFERRRGSARSVRLCVVPVSYKIYKSYEMKL